MKQREAVFLAVCEVTGEHSFEGAVTLTAEQRKIVSQQITEQFLAGKVELSESAREKYNTPEKLSVYVSGLMSNWLRKDKRLNGNIQYIPANPGSRAGQGDAQLRELRKLFKMHEGTPEAEKIQEYIDGRLAEIKSIKSKVTINAEHIPTELKNLI